MALQFTLEQGLTTVMEGEIRGVTCENDLISLFEGKAYLDGSWIQFDVEEDADEYIYRITKVEWVDEEPETSFHGYALEYINEQGIESALSIARGEAQSYKIWDVMHDYYHGFQEAVDNLIKSDGLEFVFGNGFCYHTLFELVMREIVRYYIRQHEIADI